LDAVAVVGVGGRLRKSVIVRITTIATHGSSREWGRGFATGSSCPPDWHNVAVEGDPDVAPDLGHGHEHGHGHDCDCDLDHPGNLVANRDQSQLDDRVSQLDDRVSLKAVFWDKKRGFGVASSGRCQPCGPAAFSQACPLDRHHYADAYVRVAAK